MFIGRKQELAQLKKEISKDELRTALIYGRRRVGKSKLLMKVLL